MAVSSERSEGQAGHARDRVDRAVTMYEGWQALRGWYGP